MATKRAAKAKTLEECLGTLKALIQRRYPEAQFEVIYGLDDKSARLRVQTTEDDVFGVLKAVGGRPTDYLVDYGFYITVLPLPLNEAA